MIMAFSGMDKVERQALRNGFLEGGRRKEKLPFVMLSRRPMLENVSKDVSKDLVDCTRVKDVLEVSVRPRSQGRG